MSGTKAVTYNVEGAVAIITLAKPPLNTIDVGLLDGLIAALGKARGDEGVRAVVITTALDRAFSAGLDLRLVLDGGSAVMRSLLQKLYIELFDAQHHLGKPSVAAIRGVARGGGLTIAISCDVMVAADDSSYGYPELDVGILPGIHFTHLPRVVGRARAFELLFSAEPFDAERAERLGLVNRVVPACGLRRAAMAMAEGFACKPPAAMKLARDSFMRINDLDYRRSIAGIVDTMALMADSEETRSALRRFLDGGKPAP
jgi:enoyl-CoA hydratase/carnithine racemase